MRRVQPLTDFGKLLCFNARVLFASLMQRDTPNVGPQPFLMLRSHTIRSDHLQNDRRTFRLESMPIAY